MILPRDVVEKFEKLLGDNETIRFDNESAQMKEIRDLEKHLGTDYAKTRKSVVVFWDDMMQYTTLGAIDCLLDVMEINEKFDIENFFYRGVENTNYITFLKKLFLEVYKKNLAESLIRAFIKRNYALILQRSPVAGLYETFIKSYLLHDRMMLVFRHKFEGCRELCKSILKQIPNPTGMFIEFGFLEEFNDNEFEFLKKNGELFDIIMIQDLSKAFDYLEFIKNKRNRVLIAPNVHNGVHENYIASIYGMFGSNTGVGPFNSNLMIFNEGLYVS